jgi:glycosyltransferase involved in cell wall biosynthesis
MGDERSGPMKIAVLIPCHNEERAIAAVIGAFRTALPSAAIYVYDNASTDRTVEVASAAGAAVRREPLRGKGNVVRRMFADIEADIYVLTDGDETYHAPSAPGMVAKLLEDNLDMVVGRRRETGGADAYRAGHRFGNRMLTATVAAIFGRRLIDMLSGYRVFSRRFVKSFAAVSSGFETETEMTVHALSLRLPVAEIDTPYGSRPEGSASKLRTVRDGARILLTIFNLFRGERPLVFFSMVAAILAALSIVLAIPVVIGFIETGLVLRFPTAILSTGLMLLAFLSLASGFILDAVTAARREAKRLNYLSHRSPAEMAGAAKR